MISMLSAKHSLRVEADEAHRGREVYYQVADPAYAGVGGATLETRHLKRMRVSVTASKLIFEQTPRHASGFRWKLIPS